MKATHTDYLHPKHLRVEDGGEVFCLAPSHSKYSKLARPGLPKFGDSDLPRHSTTLSLLREVLERG